MFIAYRFYKQNTKNVAREEDSMHPYLDNIEERDAEKL
jgi:hypothetical protein